MDVPPTLARAQMDAMADHVLSIAEQATTEALVGRHLDDAHASLIRAMRAADQHPDREIHRKAGFAALAVDDVQRYLTGEE